MNEFAIISIDDSRAEKKNWTRQRFTTWREAVEIDFVNGKVPDELRKAKQKWKNVETPGPFKAGEFGIFYSVLNCFEYGAANDGILYFEDDAHPVANFQEKIDFYLDHLPRKMDLFACWSPRNQTGDYAGISGFNAVGEPAYDRSLIMGIKNYADYGRAMEMFQCISRKEDAKECWSTSMKEDSTLL